MESVRISQARPRDALAVRALHLAVLEEGRYFVRTPDELPRLFDVETEIGRYQQSDNSVWLVARGDHDQVVGWLTLTGGALTRTRHVARLEMLVARAHRGAGVGGRMLDEALAWAIANPMIRKVALAVFADNAAALRLYRSRGFVDEGRRVGEYLDAHGLRDDLLLARATG